MIRIRRISSNATRDDARPKFIMRMMEKESQAEYVGGRRITLHGSCNQDKFEQPNCSKMMTVRQGNLGNLTVENALLLFEV